jgi:hypothetical protein
MQPSRFSFIQQATHSATKTPENAPAHFCFQLSDQSFSPLASQSFQPTSFSKSGKTKIRANGYCAKATTRRKTSEWSASEKPVAPLFEFLLPAGNSSPNFAYWSWRRDLNPRPSDYKSDALPTELRQRRAQMP